MHCTMHCTGGGGLVRTGEGLRFVNPPLDGSAYCNAQVDDYVRLPRHAFLHRPPLRLNVRARFSHQAGELSGTAGFGFWNDPFLMSGAIRGRWLPALPRVLWFFYAGPPADMRLTATEPLAAPNWGWKAAAIDAAHAGGLAALPFAALLAPAMRSERLYRRLWPPFERGFGIAERLLAGPDLTNSGLTGLNMTEWHDYALDWQPDAVGFWVDGREVLTVPLRLHTAGGVGERAPLGFVAWMDNQYLIIHPSGPFGPLRWGLVAKPAVQWMELADVRVRG